MAIKTDGVIQVGIVVRDIEQTLDRYVSVFGLTERPHVRNVFPTISYRGQRITSGARLTAFSLGGVVIELVQPDDKPSSWKEFLDEHGEGAHHIGFVVPDRDDALDTLASNDIGVRQFGGAQWGSYTFVDSQVLGVLLNVKCGEPFTMPS